VIRLLMFPGSVKLYGCILLSFVIPRGRTDEEIAELRTKAFGTREPIAGVVGAKVTVREWRSRVQRHEVLYEGPLVRESIGRLADGKTSLG
jgi:hypothetical protein